VPESAGPPGVALGAAGSAAGAVAVSDGRAGWPVVGAVSLTRGTITRAARSLSGQGVLPPRWLCRRALEQADSARGPRSRPLVAAASSADGRVSLSGRGYRPQSGTHTAHAQATAERTLWSAAATTGERRTILGLCTTRRELRALRLRPAGHHCGSLGNCDIAARDQSLDWRFKRSKSRCQCGPSGDAK